MNRSCLLFIIALSVAAPGFGYMVPSPLKGVGVECSVGDQKGIYKYTYKVTNPSTNDGEIGSVSIFNGTDPKIDVHLSSSGLTQCSRFHKHSSEQLLQLVPMVPVGSNGPAKWSCGYQRLRGYGEGAFGWGSIDDPYNVKPGNSMEGFTLFSYGLPGIRNILIWPDINTDLLPPEYFENVKKTDSLEDSVKWMGKTVGPKAPPAQLNFADFTDYIIGLARQSYDLGWIIQQRDEIKGKKDPKESGILNSLVEKLEHAKKAIDKNNLKEAIENLRSLLHEVDALYKKADEREKKKEYNGNEKHSRLTSEAYALLKYNTSYLIAKMIPALPKNKKDHEER